MTSARYSPRPGDAVWSIPSPNVGGFAFTRSVDPAPAHPVAGALLRGGYVYLLRGAPGGYSYDAAQPVGAALPVGGIPLTTFLSEQRFRWRRWAVSQGTDPDAAPSPTERQQVLPWAVFTSLADAAEKWGWERVS